MPRVRIKDNKSEIFDFIRKKWVALTPEEQVRQYFLHFLTEERGVAASHIAVERKIEVNSMPRRFDIVVFSGDGTPAMVVECKQPAVPLTQSVAEQAARYNMTLKAPFVAITNGESTFFFKVDFENEKVISLDDFPEIQ